MDNQIYARAKQEEEPTEAEIYKRMLDLSLAKNDDIVASLKKLDTEMQANNEELEKRLITSGTFKEVIYKAFTAFVIVQVATTISFICFLTLFYLELLR